MKTQQELKEIYREILENEIWKNNKEMVDYSIKELAHIVELTNGDIITIDKPSIKKNFCFGYNLSSQDTDSFDNANDMVSRAVKNNDYFIKENLKELNYSIDGLKNGFDYNKDYYIMLIKYYSQSPTSKLKGISILYHYDENTDKSRENKLEGENKQRVLAGYEEVKAKFEKRLNTYLKRYGLTKINSWSYWRD